MVFTFLCLLVFLSVYFICFPILCIFVFFLICISIVIFILFSILFLIFPLPSSHSFIIIIVSLFLSSCSFRFFVSSFFFWFARTNLFPFIRSCSVVEDAHSRDIVEKETFVKKCRKNVLIEKNNMNEFVKIMPLRWN